MLQKPHCGSSDQNPYCTAASMILQPAGKSACMDLVAAFPDARVFSAGQLDRGLSGTLFLGEVLKWIA